MKKILIISLLLASYIVTSAQKFYYEVPFTLTKGKIIIEANINGVNGKYIFDTGAVSSLAYSKFEKLKFKSNNESKVEDANGNLISLNKVHVNSLVLGNVDYQNLELYVMPKNHPIEFFEVDGLIGYNIFRNSIVKIDGKRKVITITNDQSKLKFNNRNGLKMIKGHGDEPLFEISLNNLVKEKVLFDSGSPAFFEYSQSKFENDQETGCSTLLSTGYGINSYGVSLEKESKKFRVKIPVLKIGTGKFKNVITTTMSSKTSRLGTGILKYGDVVINYQNNTFYYNPYSTQYFNLDKKFWNVTIAFKDDHLCAGMVWGNMHNKIKPQSVITDINGEKYDKIDVSNIYINGLKKGLSGDAATITFVNEKGEEETIEIKKE